MRTTRLRVMLRDVQPEVLRVIDVPAGSNLAELHMLLQAALGWTDSHLHQFVADDVRYGVPSEDDWDEDQRDEATASLRDLPASSLYLYDFGDGWEHQLEILGVGEDEPGCRYGHGACPPENCGGPGGYERLLAVLADPAHEDFEQLSAWAGTLAEFDQQLTDALIRRTVGEVPASVRMVLDLAQSGVKLTPGGRLPRVFVREVQERRPHWGLSAQPASIEEDLPPLAVLHGLLRSVGLLRLAKGVVRPTRAATDDLEVVRRLRSWFEPGDFQAIVAGDVVAALVIFGPQGVEELASRILSWLGEGWSRDGQPLTVHDVRRTLYSLSPAMQALDQIEIDGRLWLPGPAALTLLPRAVGIASTNS